MHVKKLKSLSSIFRASVQSNLKLTETPGVPDYSRIENLNEGSTELPISSTPPSAGAISQKRTAQQQSPLCPSTKVVKEDSRNSALEAITSILCSGHGLKASGSHSFESDSGSKVSNNLLNIPWLLNIPVTTTSHYKRLLQRERKQKWVIKNSQDRRFESLIRLCSEKLGTNATLAVFGKLGRETGVKEYNALIKVCVEKARESNCERSSCYHLQKAFQLFRSMKEEGFPLEEETYSPLLLCLIDMGLTDEFQVFRDIIEKETIGLASRLGYYEMLLWLREKDEDKVTELCSSITVNTVEDNFGLAVSYLLAFCESDREREILHLLDMVDIARISSTKDFTPIFKSLGRLLLEEQAEKLLLHLKRSGADISSLICEYATSISDSLVEEAVSKFRCLHEKLGVKATSTSYKMLVTHCCKSLKVHAALDVVDMMHQSDLALSSDIFDPILRASELSCDLDMVRPIYSLMCKHLVVLKGDTCRSVINLYVKMKDFEGAYNVLNGVGKMNLKPTASMYNAILVGYFREKNITRAKMVLKQMQQASVEPDSETFSYLISNSESEEEIIKFRADMERAGVTATKHVFMALINAYAKCGQYEKARQVVLEQGVPVKSMNEIKSALVSALSSNNQVLCALSVYEEAKKSGCRLDPKASVNLIEHLQSDENKMDTLFALLQDLKGTEYWFEGCRRVVLFCIRYKYFSSVVHLLKQIKEKNELAVYSVIDMIYSEIVDSESLDISMGLDVLRVVKEELKMKPSRTNLDFLLSICLRAKCANHAWMVWNEYEKAGLPFNVLTHLRMYQVLLATGKQKSAAEMRRKIHVEDPHVRCLIKSCKMIFCEQENRNSNKSEGHKR